jgi:NAD+ kinase
MNRPITAVGIISKPRKAELREIVPALARWLEERRVEVLIDRETALSLDGAGSGLPRSELAARVDLVVVLGGDGTVLSTARAVGEHSIPILAVNLGGLGFLTAVTLPEMYAALEQVLAGKHQLDCRRKLLVDATRQVAPGQWESIASYHALNDAVLNKASLARILDFEAFLDGEFVSTFKADGLIISTPTGSTAYSISAGGPIVVPSADAMLVTPIASHTLTNRPLVVPSRSTIEVVVKSQEEAVFLTVDGQVGLALQNMDRVVCRPSPQLVHLVRPAGKSYFEVLRSKLKWGQR